MACGDVLSLEDLQTAKKHQIFEAEVITGKAGGVAGGATIGTATNPVTGQTQQTLPSILADLGFDVQSWTSSTGGVLASANQVFLNDTPGSLGLGDYYAWGGTFPKTVPAGTDPALPTSGYIMRSSRLAGVQAREALRRSYAEASYNLVDGSFEAGGALVNTNDVLLQERTGKAFSGPAGTVAAGTNPASGGFVDRSRGLLRSELFATVSSVSAGGYGVGAKLTITDRDNARFNVVAGGTPNGIDILNAGTGKTATLVIVGNELNASWLGFKLSNPDNAPILQRAVDIARTLKYPVRMPPGNAPFNCSRVTVYQDTVLRGAGEYLTELKAPNGASTGSDIICSENADTLFGTNSDNGAHNLELSDFSLNGNRQRTGNSSGITSGTCLKYYGRTNRFKNLRIYHSADDGMRTEWGTGGNLTEGLEGRFSSITIGYSGGNGWRFGGPHDSHCDDIIIHTSGQKATNTYKNLFIEKGNARWSKVHSYSLFYTDQGAPNQANRVSHALYIAGGGGADGNEFIESHIEGGMVNVYNGANGTIIDGSCRIYYPWNGANIVNDGSNCKIKAWLGEEFKGIGLPLAKGIVFGGTYGGSTNCLVELMGGGMEAGWVDWGGIGGHNRIVVRGYNLAGVAQVGTPISTNDVDIYVHGPSLDASRQESFQTRNSVAKIIATGSSQSDATNIDKSVRTVAVSGGAADSGLRLPNSAILGDGHKVQVTDITGSAKKLYPNVGGNILGLGVDAPANIPALGTVHLTVVNAELGEWLLG